MRNDSNKSFRENQKILCLKALFSKIVPFDVMRRNIVKPEQATDDNKAHALCMLES